MNTYEGVPIRKLPDGASRFNTDSRKRKIQKEFNQMRKKLYRITKEQEAKDRRSK